MTAGAAWTALVLAVLELALLVGVVVLVARFWRQARPQLQPLLAMFTAPAGAVTPGAVGSPSGRPLAVHGETMPRALDEDAPGAPLPQCGYVDLIDGRCVLEQGHAGVHAWPARAAGT